VNRSPGTLRLVPCAVFTRTSATPAPFGATAVSCPGASTWNEDAALEPNSTRLTAPKYEPSTFTVVPPAAGPVVGLTSPTTGAGGTYVKRLTLVAELVPSAV
jgi:hypothetical protein